jgi:hypothetical protein
MITKNPKVEKMLLLVTLLANLAFTGDKLKDYVLEVKTIRVVEQKEEKYLIATVKLTNNTADTLKYLSMTCSYEEFYLLKSKTLRLAGYECDKNVPKTVTIPPHKSDSVGLKFKVPGDGKQPIKYKVGLMLVKNEGDNLLKLLYHKPMKHITVWSDEVSYSN